MSAAQVVAMKTLAMFLVMMVGWVTRKSGRVDGQTTGFLGVFTTDVALPVLIFTQMLATLDRASLAESWPVAVGAVAVVGLGHLVGWAFWRLFATRAQAPSFIFLVTLGNWVYLPLPIIEELFGPPGVRLLLLCNAAVQVYVWTAGVAILHGGKLDRRALGNLATNPGLLATIAGIAAALLVPGGWIEGLPIWAAFGLRGIREAMVILAAATIPLSLVVIGLQLGGLPLRGHGWRAISGVTLLRLGVVPLLTLGGIWLLRRGDLGLDQRAWMILFLISAMPVAVSCSVLTQRFNQDSQLAAQTILYTTFLSLATVPAWVWLFQKIAFTHG